MKPARNASQGLYSIELTYGRAFNESTLSLSRNVVELRQLRVTNPYQQWKVNIPAKVVLDIFIRNVTYNLDQMERDITESTIKKIYLNNTEGESYVEFWNYVDSAIINDWGYYNHSVFKKPASIFAVEY